MDLHPKNPRHFIDITFIMQSKRKASLILHSQSYMTIKLKLGKPCTTVQPAKVNAKSSSCKLLPKKVHDVQDTGKPSELVSRGFHIKT